jgi:hypothetical protein
MWSFLKELGNYVRMGAKESAEMAQGKRIESIKIDNDTGVSMVHFVMQCGGELDLFDDGQSCCEHRYFTCDDDLTQFWGAEIVDVVLKPGGETENDDVHEWAFVEVVTSKGSFTFTAHNDHNGYYGGINLSVMWKDPTTSIGGFNG